MKATKATATKAYLRITGNPATLTKEPRADICAFTDPQGRWFIVLWSRGQVIGWRFDGTTHWLPLPDPHAVIRRFYP